MTRSPWLLLLWIGCAAGAVGVRAQVPESPLFRSMGTVDGLPSNTVYRLAQDRDGYLWVGTGDGLARFDGVGFSLWQHEPERADSLAGNVVQALHIDARDRVWLGSEGGGLSVLDAGRRGVTHLRAPDDPRFALADVWSIASDRAGSIWFGGYGGGLYRYHPERDEVTVFRHDPARADSLAADHILTLAFDADDTLWIGTTAGLDRFRDGRFDHVRAGAGGLSAATVLSLLPEPDGRLWIGTVGGVDVRAADETVAPAAPRAQLQRMRAAAMLRDRFGAYWIAGSDGLRHWTEAAARAGDEARSVLGGGVSDALEDHEGGLWFATLAGGLHSLPPNWRNFTVLRSGDAARGGLSGAVPRGVAEAAGGGLWVVGANGVLDRVLPDGRVERHLDARLRLPDPRSASVLESDDGSVWIGQHTGLARYDPTRAELQYWGPGSADDATPPGQIDLLLRGPDGTLWLSANGAGVQQRAPDGRVLATFAADGDAGLASGDTQAMQFAPDGALWLAGDDGVRRLASGASRFDAVEGIARARSFGLDFDAEGGLWLQHLGVLERYVLDADRARRVARIDSRDGLPAVEAGGLRVDAAGDVWLTSARGLWRYRPASGELRGYGVRDGLPGPEFGNRPHLRTRAGALVATSVDGVVWFDPARLRRSDAAPRLRFEAVDVRRDGVALVLDPSQPLALRHDDRELRVGARLLSFADPRAHRYRFRLSGFERDWIDAGASGERVFTQLPAGDFVLQAVAANADGVWSAPPLTLRIAVASPWWSTRSAIAAYAVTLALLLALAAAMYRRALRRRVRIGMSKQRHEWTLRASAAKTRFLATLGHEIRTPMTGVLGMAELLARSPLSDAQRGYATSIQRSGELLLRLVNDALDLARIEAGRLELAESAVDLPALLGEVEAQLQPLAQRKQLRLHCTVAPEAPRCVRGDAMRLQQILLNLGNNALKFTEHGGVELALEAAPAPDTVTLRVSDTGPGLDDAQRARLFRRFEQADGADTARRHGGSGLGLAICEELALAMGGRIAIDSAPGRGSDFRVILPLPRCVAEDAMAAAAASGDADAPDPRASRRILLVEDDATVASVVTGLLELQGHAVVHVAQGLAALAELEAATFDLAFLDLDLPGIDGIALARLLRERHPSLAMLALTARADAEAEPQALAAGMRGFLRKPVSGAQLARAIATLSASTPVRETIDA